ncbi:MAG TPA: hypothetical protein V6D23_05745, partial [Candidatus Obscuribacterales bacterium]
TPLQFRQWDRMGQPWLRQLAKLLKLPWRNHEEPDGESIRNSCVKADENSDKYQKQHKKFQKQHQ